MTEVTTETSEALVPAGQLFLECAEDGRILWMSEKCRERLGDAANLADQFTPDQPGKLQALLSGFGLPDPVSGVYRRSDGVGIRVSVHLLTRLVGGVLLSAEVLEKAGDRISVMDDGLLWLYTVVLENYFRLLRAQQGLDSRMRRARRNPGELLMAQLEQERARLGRELHSGPGQWLSAIAVHVELIEKKAPDLPPDIRQYLARIAGAAAEAGAEIRAVAHRLHPLGWRSGTLAEALRNLWDNSGIPEQFQASLEIATTGLPSPGARAAIYRTAQEALSNAIRHSGATEIRMSLTEKDRNLHLRIEDNGKGFDPAARPATGGIGLSSIREQVEALGGKFEISSGAQGTKLGVTVPLESNDE